IPFFVLAAVAVVVVFASSFPRPALSRPSPSRPRRLPARTRFPGPLVGVVTPTDAWRIGIGAATTTAVALPLVPLLPAVRRRAAAAREPRSRRGREAAGRRPAEVAAAVDPVARGLEVFGNTTAAAAAAVTFLSKPPAPPSLGHTARMERRLRAAADPAAVRASHGSILMLLLLLVVLLAILLRPRGAVWPGHGCTCRRRRRR
ncbi:unnamed protein product, partial [Ectocarpus fasciculatus]